MNRRTPKVMPLEQRSVIPGFGLTLGDTLLYLSLIVISRRSTSKVKCLATS